MFQDFQQINLFPASAPDILANLLVALICGIVLSLVYRFIYRGPSYSSSYVNSIVMLAVIASMIVLVIGNNIARAFGLVGALSIIRFRTAIRDTMDLVFIFLSLAVGLAAGVGLSIVAVLGTLVCSTVIVLLTLTRFSQPRRRHHLLHLSYLPEGHDDTVMARLMSQYCKSVKLVSLRNSGQDSPLEAHYWVTFRKDKQSPALVQSLQAMPTMKHINVYFDEDDYNPPTL